MNDSPKYILQKSCRTCPLITVLNAHIHRGEKIPFEYMSKTYIDFVKTELRGGYFKNDFGEDELYYGTNGEQTANVIAKAFDIKYSSIEYKRVPDFQDAMIKGLKRGWLIDFSCYTYGMHSCLVCDYNPDNQTFKVVNGQFFNRESPVEWLPFGILIGATPKRNNRNGGTNYSFPWVYSLSKAHSKFTFAKASKFIKFK